MSTSKTYGWSQFLICLIPQPLSFSTHPPFLSIHPSSFVHLPACSYSMFQKIYLHRATRSLEVMLCDLLTEADVAWGGRLRNSINDPATYVQLQDTALLSEIAVSGLALLIVCAAAIRHCLETRTNAAWKHSVSIHLLCCHRPAVFQGHLPLYDPSQGHSSRHAHAPAVPIRGRSASKHCVVLFIN